MALSLPGLSSVAVVEFYETIRGGRRGAEAIALLDGVRRNKGVKAVVLDIDSPGGSAVASEYLYMATRKLAAEKPVIAFVRGAGASGSYMLACGAQRIIAIPTAIIGSIGVISIRPLVPDLLARVGVQIAVNKTGPYKDSGAFYRLPTDEELEREQALIAEYYDRFLDIIVEGRKLDRETVRSFATGAIFTARKAQTMGLVDELGDLDTAIDAAAKMAGIKRRVTHARPRRPLPQRLLSGASSIVMEEITAHVERWLLTKSL